MFLVKTYLDRSRIHGIGVFAGEFIRKDTKIWRFVIGFDQYYSLKKFRRLPKQARDYLKFLEKESGAKIAMISTGPDRDHTIFLDKFVKELKTAAKKA